MEERGGGGIPRQRPQPVRQASHQRAGHRGQTSEKHRDHVIVTTDLVI